MSYISDKILESLKEARQQKGLSQRELSARSGVPQSHISKIESGAVDLRVSSLIALARVLELELELVPKKIIPAVRSIVRSGNNFEMSLAPKQLKAQFQAYRDVLESLPQLDKVSTESVKRARSAIKTMEGAIESAIGQYKPSPAVIKALELSREEVEKALKNSGVDQLATAIDEPPSNQLCDSIAVDEGVQKALTKAARQLVNLRNTLAHQGMEAKQELSGPAYSLEGDDDA